MLQHNQPPPTGPKATRSSRSNSSDPRLSTRAGIHKRRNGPVRSDTDGDIDMVDVTGSRRNRRSRARRSDRTADVGVAVGRRDEKSSTSGGGFGSAAAQKAILRSMGSGAASIRGPKGGLNLATILGEATSRGKGQDKRVTLHEISVRGWKQSKAALNRDGGVTDLLAFLERKATATDAQAVKIIKSRTEGDALIVSVKPEDASKILRLNTFMFAGAPLAVEEKTGVGSGPEKGTSIPPIGESSEAALGTRQKMTAVLNRRYDSELKLLNLSALGKDPELNEMGMFTSVSTESKFFPALMKVCDSIFASPQQKHEAVLSVTLASNDLLDIKAVTSLSQTFPDLKNLDLSNNQLKDLRSLSAWRWKFRHLDHLVLSGNPIDAELSTHKDEILKWYPTLRILNGIQVRSEEDIVAATKGKLPLPILPASFRDEASIAENFIKHFFPAFDTDRTGLVNGYYDAQSTFSLSVNTSAPRAPEQPAGHEKMKPLSWDAYIKKSRNLLKVTHLPTRMSRAHVGTDSIRDTWLSLPPTRHPDLLAEPHKWLIECTSLPGLPDPSNQSPAGVGGLLITVHGEFHDLDPATAHPTQTRSFDRAFVLGPGAGVGGIRVLSDILTLRAWGGSAAWTPDSEPQPATTAPAPPFPAQPSSALPEAFGVAAPGKTEDQLRMETMVLELGRATGMNVEYAALCLEQSGWTLDAALAAFQTAKANLPPEAFV